MCRHPALLHVGMVKASYTFNYTHKGSTRRVKKRDFLKQPQIPEELLKRPHVSERRLVMGGHVGSKGRTSRGRGRQWADCDRLCLRNQ